MKRSVQRAPFAHDLPRRQCRRQAGQACDLAPDPFGELLARRIDEPVAGANGHREPAREGEQPLHCAVEHAEDWRLRRRRLDAKMRIDDSAVFARRFQIGQQRQSDVWRHCENDRVVRTKRHRVGAEIEGVDPPGRKTQRPQLMLHAHAGTALLQMGERWIDQRRAQAFARNQRPASSPPDRQRLADDGASEPRRAVRRVDIERGKEKRFDKAVIKPALAGDDFAH